MFEKNIVKSSQQKVSPVMMIKHFRDLHLLLMKSGLFVFMYLSSSVSCLKKNEKVGIHIYQEE